MSPVQIANARGAIQLCYACIHEFSWQVFPWEYQGAWRNVTQWLVISWAAFCAARPERSKFLSASMLATALMSSTTALCSSAWLIHPWPLAAGKWQCSQWLGWPVHLLSVAVVLLALIRWGKREQQ